MSHLKKRLGYLRGIREQFAKFTNIVYFYYQLNRFRFKCVLSSDLVEHFLPVYVKHWACILANL